MQKYFDEITREASRLHNDGFPFLATILRDAVATGDKDRVDSAVERAVAILDMGKRFTAAGKLRVIAAKVDSAKRTALWG